MGCRKCEKCGEQFSYVIGGLTVSFQRPDNTVIEQFYYLCTPCKAKVKEKISSGEKKIGDILRD